MGGLKTDRLRHYYCGVWIAASCLGMIWSLFPIGLDRPSYITLISLGGQFLFIGVFFLLLPFLCWTRAGKTVEQLLTISFPHFGPAFYRLSLFLLGPFGFAPLIVYTTVNLICTLLGISGILPTAIINILLLIIGWLFVRPCFFKREKKLFYPILAAASLILLFLFSIFFPIKYKTAHVEMSSCFPLTALDCHIGLPIMMAPVLLKLGYKDESQRIKRIKESKCFIPVSIGILIVAITSLTWFVFGASQDGNTGLSMAAIAVQHSCGIYRFLTGLSIGVVTILLLTNSLTAFFHNLLPENTQSSFSGFRITLTFIVIFILTLPPMGAIYLKISSSLLAGIYPVLAVTVIFYALFPNPFEPRKQYSLRLALCSAYICGIIVAAYQITIRFGISAPLFQGIYESLVMSQYHMTWLPISTLFFIVGDTHYRGKKGK